MNTKLLLAGLMALVTATLLSSCSMPASSVFAAPDPPDPPRGVTPIDTSAHTLIVTIAINEDQDATDHTSNITFKFRTDVIKEDNFVIFDADQHIKCNRASLLTLANASSYTLKVPQHEYDEQRYTCWYVGYTQDIGLLAPVTMFDIPLRSTLSPQPPVVDNQGYKIKYMADSSDLACQIKAEAVDASNKHIPGPASSSDQGTYFGPTTNSLQGKGEIILTRTCSWTWHKPFNMITLTYQSTASVEVTWTH